MVVPYIRDTDRDDVVHRFRCEKKTPEEARASLVDFLLKFCGVADVTIDPRVNEPSGLKAVKVEVVLCLYNTGHDVRSVVEGFVEEVEKVPGVITRLKTIQSGKISHEGKLGAVAEVG